MKLFLSSYHLGNNPQDLANLFSTNKKVAVIANAQDILEPDEREERVTREFNDLKALGLQPAEVDLRNYFGKKEALAQLLNAFGGVWIRGGNAFVLRKAMYESGMDEYVLSKLHDEHFVYAGFSAALCVLSPSLHGYELVDDPHANPTGYKAGIMWEGLSILPYSIVPHYQSDHFESPLVEKSLEYLKKNIMPYKTLRDGEVLIDIIT
ncbi:MAG: Type 1 glutamine amidotransferase-like domain-containing protein [Microgenomates group bacterium]